MQNFLLFVTHHWALWTAFSVILALIVLLELQERMRGAKPISTQAMVALINQKDAVVIDIRDEAAFNKGHILHALSLPQGRLVEESKKLEKYRGKPIILVCELGQQSPIAGALLRQQFDEVYCLRGGVSAWSNAGLPLKRG